MSATIYTMPPRPPRIPAGPRALAWRGHAAILREELHAMTALLSALAEEAAASERLETPLVCAGSWGLDLGNLTLFGPGQTIAVSFQEAKPLQALLEAADSTVPRAALLRLLTGAEANERQLHNVNVRIMRLRRKLGAAAIHLQTVRPVGFRWCTQPAQTEVM